MAAGGDDAVGAGGEVGEKVGSVGVGGVDNVGSGGSFSSGKFRLVCAKRRGGTHAEIGPRGVATSHEGVEGEEDREAVIDVTSHFVYTSRDIPVPSHWDWAREKSLERNLRGKRLLPGMRTAE